MKLYIQPNGNGRAAGPDLLEMSFDLTVYGLMLALIMSFTTRRLDATGVAVICCFLASVFLFRMVSPTRLLLRHFWWRATAVALIALSVWSLLYQAENTRAGWYRFHVLQTRVQQLISRAPAYVITTDADGYVTGSSDNIQTLVGWRKEEIIGKHVHMFMRDWVIPRHDAAFQKAVDILRADGTTPNAGWAIQGEVTMGLKVKGGSVVPVRIYAGGIRWSQNLPFAGDTDLFAVVIPVSPGDSRRAPTTIPEGEPIGEAVTPPLSPPLAPVEHKAGEALDRGEVPLMAVPGSKGRVPPPRIP